MSDPWGRSYDRDLLDFGDLDALDGDIYEWGDEDIERGEIFADASDLQTLNTFFSIILNHAYFEIDTLLNLRSTEEDNIQTVLNYNFDVLFCMKKAWGLLIKTKWKEYFGISLNIELDQFLSCFTGMTVIFRIVVIGQGENNSDGSYWFYNYPITINFALITTIDEFDDMGKDIYIEISNYLNAATQEYKCRRTFVVGIRYQLFIRQNLIPSSINPIKVSFDEKRNFSNHLQALKLLNQRRNRAKDFELKWGKDDIPKKSHPTESNIAQSNKSAYSSLNLVEDNFNDNANREVERNVVYNDIRNQNINRGMEGSINSGEVSMLSSFISDRDSLVNPDYVLNNNNNIQLQNNFPVADNSESIDFSNQNEIREELDLIETARIVKDNLGTGNANVIHADSDLYLKKLAKKEFYDVNDMNVIVELTDEEKERLAYYKNNLDEMNNDSLLNKKSSRKRIFDIDVVIKDGEQMELNKFIRLNKKRVENENLKKKRQEEEEKIKKEDEERRNNRGIGNWFPIPETLEKLRFIFNPRQTMSLKGSCFLMCTVAALNNIQNENTLFKIMKNVLDGIDQRLVGVENVRKNVTVNLIKSFAFANNLKYVIWEVLERGDLYCVNKKCEINPKAETEIFLLLIRDHFALINNVEAFVLMIKNINHRNYLVCHLCKDNVFRTTESLEKHIESCVCSREGKNFKLLDDDKCEMKFKNHANKINHLNVMYADIESILVKVDIEKKSTKFTSIHKPIMIGTFLLNKELDNNQYNLFEGTSCIDYFLNHVRSVVLNIRKKYLKKYIKIEFTNEKSKCLLCNEDVNNGVFIVRGFGMLPSNCILHRECFDKFNPKRELIIIFHNLKGYDSHFIVDKFSKECTKFFTVPKTREKYTFFTGEIHNIKVKFIDSYAFLQDSLASLAKNLNTSKFRFMKGREWSFFPKELIGQKIPFPYEYIDSEEKLYESEFPSDQKHWYSSLSNHTPSINDISKALNIFNNFDCQNIGDYMKIYLKVDVYLLAEIFEEFRYNVLKNYKVDPCHYFTTPGLAWDCAFSFIYSRNKDFKLELLNREDLISFFTEPGTIRGGISTVSSLKYIDNLKEDEAIHYLDVTNLYGYAMTFSLPTGGFKFLQFDDMMYYGMELLDAWFDEYEYGLIYEIDAYIDPAYHNKYNDLPLLPSFYDKKLSPNFFKKTNYKIHVALLQQAYRFEGLVITKISRILQFNQSPWLKDYVEFNTDKRLNSSSESERSFYKLMNNGVYGKTLEDEQKRSDLKFFSINDYDKMIEEYYSFGIKYYSKFTENIYISEKNERPFFSKPVYVGFTILELSKRHMYFLLYDVVKPILKAELMYMDTDSFVIYTKEKIDWMRVSSCFDLSCFGIDRNKGKLGTLKIEYPHKKITKFYGLCAKTYIVTFTNWFFKKYVIKNKGCDNYGIGENHFRKALMDEDYVLKKDMVSLRSFNHDIFTVVQNKLTLSFKEDNKRYSYSLKNTYARGHIGEGVDLIKKYILKQYFKKY
jgi:hypothetical protein